MIQVLRENGIEVTAIHSHMLDEQRRLFFVHFWANDDAIKLATGLEAALQKVAVEANNRQSSLRLLHRDSPRGLRIALLPTGSFDDRIDGRDHDKREHGPVRS